jgi:hypothetical protein
MYFLYEECVRYCETAVSIVVLLQDIELKFVWIGLKMATG